MDFATWRNHRLAELTAADGWLSLVGLFWLSPGEQTLGSAADNSLVLPVGPAHWGTLTLGDEIRWQAAGKAAEILQIDTGAAPSVIRAGEVSFILIERDGQIALRLRDNTAAARQQFKGIATFEYATAWQLEARWEANPQTIAVATMTGGLETRQVSGRAWLTHEGKEYALTPLDENDQGLFFVFADATSGKKDGNGSYGGGRFLWALPPENGRLLLDFNRAYNPPCAFTPYATCPLAPPENRLPFAVRAGEKYSPTP